MWGIHLHYYEGYQLTSARFNIHLTLVRMWVDAYDSYDDEGLSPKYKGPQ